MALIISLTFHQHLATHEQMDQYNQLQANSFAQSFVILKLYYLKGDQKLQLAPRNFLHFVVMIFICLNLYLITFQYEELQNSQLCVDYQMNVYANEHLQMVLLVVKLIVFASTSQVSLQKSLLLEFQMVFKTFALSSKQLLYQVKRCFCFKKVLKGQFLSQIYLVIMNQLQSIQLCCYLKSIMFDFNYFSIHLLK